jgi:sugar lactone lactonase YvrE
MGQPQPTTTTYTITTVAGNGSSDFSSGLLGLVLAKDAALVPKGVAVDPLGNLFVIDAGSATAQRPSTIRLVAAGIITTLACDGLDPLGTPPWGPILDVHQALCGNLTGVALDAIDNVFIAQGGGRTIDLVLTGVQLVAINNTDVNGPQNMASDGRGNIFVADTGNCRIVQTNESGGASFPVVGGTCGFSGDNSFARAASLLYPYGVAADGNGNLFIADTGNARIRKVDASGIITTVAGNGCTTYGGGDGGPATNASLCSPVDVAADASGNLFIAEYNPGLIRRVDPTGTITTIAGGVNNTALGDDGPATNAHLQFPYSLALGPGGTVYVSDSGNFRVRVLTPVSPTLITNVAVTSSGLVFSRVTQTFTATFTVTNTGTQAIAGPIQLVLTNLPAGVTVANATGTTNGNPFLTIPGVASLAPAGSASVSVHFQNPSNQRITTTALVYSGSF